MSEVFNDTTNYKVVYVFSADIESHKGCLKIGDATIHTKKDADDLPPNCDELNAAALKRIKVYTNTAGIKVNLLHAEIAVREKTTSKGNVVREIFRDKTVQAVLDHSGFAKKVFPGTTADEWYTVGLGTVKKAIGAVKKFMPSLTSAEVQYEEPPVELREEQRAAVDKTLKRFRKKNDMLWDAKMRFGKTLTSLQVVKEGGYRRVAIITHRPVVGSGWEEDFRKIFRKEDEPYIFIDKSALSAASYNAKDQKANDEELSKLDKTKKNFIYFASIQDLRGSQRVGGKYAKNEGVFDLDWDMVIVDEAHEGTQTDLGESVIKEIVKADTKVLALSGTPFNILSRYEEDAVYVWDYVMEQSCKEHWDENHPRETNPYADLPKLNIYTYSLGEEFSGYTEEDLQGKAFNFREFFRTWTGDEDFDGRKIPAGRYVGDFVHRDDVYAFLDLITETSKKSRYPFSSTEHRELFKHTLWMVPGVAAARALSDLLRKHPVFRNFGIANVAGEGDDFEEAKYADALKMVRDTIKDNEYSITLSCGKLTTGVTVKEWTGVMMLSGSVNTSAASYMQTIFRVQSAGQIDGRQKENAYVFDFAPDRTIRVLAETVQISRRVAKNNADEDGPKKALSEFLNYCSVISIAGTEMREYDVPKMMGQLKHVFVMKAIRNGFDDSAIYSDKLLRLTKMDARKFERLKKIVGSSKQTNRIDSVVVGSEGFADEVYSGGERKPQKEMTAEERAQREARVKARKEREQAISILRAISIRMPLLIYGADVPLDEDIPISGFASLVDDESWEEFMPAGVTKKIFSEFIEYYDADVFLSAGKEIRRLAKSADALSPTARVQQIARIFSYFKNPDKETVLTPWRVVNMHLSQTLGGWCFWNKDFTETIESPRRVVKNGVIEGVFTKSDSRVLEINSKSGLYPLYMAYSLYRQMLGIVSEQAVNQAERMKLWKAAVAAHVFVVCKTPMAQSITRRTLLGYVKGQVNTLYIKDLIKVIQNNPNKFYKGICKGNVWNNKELQMKTLRFDAVVGNPPYQQEVAKKQSETNGQARRKSIFQFFQMAADMASSGYTSLIYPGGRWLHRSGKGMEEFGLNQINDSRLAQIDFYPDSREVFDSVAIADGLSIVFKDMNKSKPGFKYVYHKEGNVMGYDLECPGNSLIPLNPYDGTILAKVRCFCEKTNLSVLSGKILSQKFFGIESDFVEKNPQKVKEYTAGKGIDFKKEIKLFTNDRAGKAGRSRWYVAKRSIIKENVDAIDKWKVVVSSANAGGQKRDWQLEVFDNHSAFGRSRVALGVFDTKSEAENFCRYCQTEFVRFLFLMTDESLTSLAKEVLDFGDYTKSNQYLDFSKDLNSQLCSLVGLTKKEKEYIVSRINAIDASRGR